MLDNSYTFLVAEDDVDDRLLMEVAFQQYLSPEDQTTFFENGRDLVEYLQKSGNSSQKMIVIVDLNMPIMNGKEVITYLKKDRKFCHMPLIAFTTSRSEEDVTYCYDNGVNAFMVKPTTFDQMERAIGNMVNFWKDVRLAG